MSSLLQSRPSKELRAPETEILGDGRKRLTRFFGVASLKEIPAELNLAPGTLDTFPQADLAAAWQGLRHTYKKLTDEVPLSGKDSHPVLQLTYEQIDATAETPEGGQEEIKLEDGRTAKIDSFVQFSTATYNPEVVGALYASGYLLKEEAPDDGTLRKIKRTFVTAGVIKQVDQEKNDGKLLLRTVTSVHTVPATPGGYVLIAQDVQNPNGLPTYTYSFAQGNGEISRSTEYRLSEDQGVHGMTVITIKYLSASSVGSTPITPPAGTVLIEDDHEDLDGYRMWTGIYAKGTGTVTSSVTLQNKGKLVIYSITALGAAPSAPAPTIGGTVELIESSQRRDRFHQGVVIYEYRWAEGNGQVKIKVTGRADGSLEYVVVELENAKTTPAYPGSGTGYLVDLDQDAIEGCYRNTATYIKPPADDTYKKTKTFHMPGLASIGGSPIQYSLSPPVEREILVDVVVTYATSQITDVPFSVSSWGIYQASWIPYANPGPSPTPGSPPTDTTTSPPKQTVEALGGYLAGSSGTSGTNDFFNGVFCQKYTFQLASSTPSSRPTGATVIETDNDPYLTATDGTKVYRRMKVSYTF